MSIYRIEKSEQSVVLFQADGSIMKGKVFLWPSHYSHNGQQTLLDLMQDKEAFFPFRSEKGDFCVANKATITHISYDPERSENASSALLGSAEDVLITFVGGEQLRGTIIIELPESHKRLIDFFNAIDGYFWMRTDDSHHLVNSAQVRDIHPA